MEDTRPAFMITDSLFRFCARWLKAHRWSLLGALVGGLLAYCFAFANKLPNFDDVVWLFSKGATLESGRWGLLPLTVFFPDYSMPWLYGMVSLMILAVGTALITESFRIRNPMLQGLLSAAIVCFPSQIGTFTYMFTACAYAVAFTLSVLAVRLLQEKSWLYRLGALCCAVYAAGIYQAYIAITATLLILLLVQSLLTETEKAVVLFVRGLGYVVFLGLSMGIYWLVTKLLWQLSGTGMGNYASYAFSASAQSIFDGIRQAYVSFSESLRYGMMGLMPTFPSRILHVLCFLAVGLEIVVWMFRDRNVGRGLLMLFLLAILPLSINCMYLFIAQDAIHTLVLYGFAMFYVLFALVAQAKLEESCKGLKLLRQFAREGLVLALLVITGINICISNEVYLNLHLSYENTYAVTNSVITMVQNQPGYTKEEPVAILGTYARPDYYHEQFLRLDRITAACGISPTDYSSPWFWEHFCGFPVNPATKEIRLELLETPEYAAMPSWPDAGCVQRINGVIAVKFS